MAINPIVCENPYLEMAGPILVLAGPGTGKTYQLARRIQTLVDAQSVNPEEITVITFTREAALGMRAKLGDHGKAEYVEPEKRPRNIMRRVTLGCCLAEGEALAAVARVMQISRQAIYRTLRPRRPPLRRPVTDPVDLAIVEMAKSYPTDGYRMVCCFVRRSLGVAVTRNGCCG